MTKIILASGSPRRFELLSMAGFEPEVIKPGCREVVEPGLTPDKVVESLAEQKGKYVLNSGSYNDIPLLAADTVVAIGGEILGKPKDHADAERMIALLSGKTHQVYTGVAIFCKGRSAIFSVKSDVLFKTVSQKEIDFYCGTEEPYDKAGAYAIQGIASFMIRSINGSYSNVIGLPICEVIEHFQALGIER